MSIYHSWLAKCAHTADECIVVVHSNNYGEIKGIQCAIIPFPPKIFIVSLHLNRGLPSLKKHGGQRPQGATECSTPGEIQPTLSRRNSSLTKEHQPLQSPKSLWLDAHVKLLTL